MNQQVKNTLAALRRGQQVTVIYDGKFEHQRLRVTGKVDRRSFLENTAGQQGRYRLFRNPRYSNLMQLVLLWGRAFYIVSMDISSACSDDVIFT